MESKGWNWEKIKDERWDIPSEDVYYLAHRWKEQGKLKFLDLGCGVGRHALFFLKQGFKVYAFDISESGLNILREKAERENLDMNIDLGDMLFLPYPSDFFDSILAYHVIYHTNKKGIKKVISEIWRVLGENSEVYLTFNSKESPSFKNPKHKRIDENTLIKMNDEEEGILHYYVDENEVFDLLRKFKIIKMRYIKEIIPSSGFKYHVLAQKVQTRFIEED
ncbi:MAG: SAM-dependent methyltransferase [Dictyoglomus sp. NZ13-RE01]|nr:MAG: SAM-dependent methyltransferase [Dictyoglomus sp. NZ13-RE01]